MKNRLLVIVILSFFIAPFANAQSPNVGASPLPPTDNYADTGPFKTVSEANTGPDGTYTIVRPETLGENGFIHSPIIFGPGIGGSVDSMMNLLERIASHGFVIIGRQLDAGPGNPENNRRMTAGLDWLIEQNSTAGSILEARLDVEHAASMGYSVGGTGAVDIGGHEAIADLRSITSTDLLRPGRWCQSRLPGTQHRGWRPIRGRSTGHDRLAPLLASQ